MGKELTLDAAERVIEAAKKRAHEIATPMSISWSTAAPTWSPSPAWTTAC